MEETASGRSPGTRPRSSKRTRRPAVAVVVVLAVCAFSVYMTARAGGDQSAIALLPDDNAVALAWPRSSVPKRAPDSARRKFESESMIFGIRLADGSGLGIKALDYRSPARAWSAAKALSPGWNGYYWDYPQRKVPSGSVVDQVPPSGKLVGFECDDDGESLECERWLLWWKRGRGIWQVQWLPLRPVDATAAVNVMSPLWHK